MEGRRVERVHLDALAELDLRSLPEVADAKPAASPEFGRLLQALLRQRKSSPGEASPRALLADFVAPSITDPLILSGDRAIALLERLLETALPLLEENEEFRVVASAVVGEEIAQRRRLRSRRRKDTAA
jgi:hypothetical protein